MNKRQDFAIDVHRHLLTLTKNEAVTLSHLHNKFGKGMPFSTARAVMKQLVDADAVCQACARVRGVSCYVYWAKKQTPEKSKGEIRVMEVPFSEDMPSYLKDAANAINSIPVANAKLVDGWMKGELPAVKQAVEEIRMATYKIESAIKYQLYQNLRG